LDTTKARRRIEYLLFAAVTFVPFIYISAGAYKAFFHAPNKLHGLTLIIAIFLLILLQNRKSLSDLIQPDPININLLVYFLLLMISLYFALDFELAFFGSLNRKEGFTTLIIYFMFFLAARTIRIPDQDLMRGFSDSATILSVYGIAQFYGVDPFLQNFIITGKGAVATFGNPNFFGSYIVLVIPIILHSFINNKENVSAIIYSVMLYALLCTRTRGTWIGAAVALVMYLIIYGFFSVDYKQNLRRIVCILIISILVISVFNNATDNLFIKRFTSISTDAEKIISGGEEAEKAGSNRIFIWKGVLELIKDRPLTGYGIENLRAPFSARFGQEMIPFFHTQYVDRAHNEYLHIAVTTGIPALIVYLLLITQILYRSFKKLRQNKIYFPFAAAILGYLAQAFFNISVLSVAYIFWIYLGLISSYEDKS